MRKFAFCIYDNIWFQLVQYLNMVSYYQYYDCLFDNALNKFWIQKRQMIGLNPTYNVINVSTLILRKNVTF